MCNCTVEDLVREESPKALNAPNHTQLWNERGRVHMIQMARYSKGAVGLDPLYGLSAEYAMGYVGGW